MKPEQRKAGTGGSKEDYSLAAMEAALVKANNGRPLTDKQWSEVRSHFEKIEAARKKVEDCAEARLNAECEHYLELMQDEILAEAEGRKITLDPSAWGTQHPSPLSLQWQRNGEDAYYSAQW